MNKREFIKYSSYLIGGTFLSGQVAAATPYFTEKRGKRKNKSRLEIKFTPLYTPA